LRPELVDFNASGLAYRIPISTGIQLGSPVSLLLQTSEKNRVAHLITRVQSLAAEGHGKLRVGGRIEGTLPLPQSGRFVPAEGDVVRVTARDQEEKILSAIGRYSDVGTLTIKGGPETEVSVRRAPEDRTTYGIYLSSPVGGFPDDSMARLQLSVHGAHFIIDGRLRIDDQGFVYLAAPFSICSVSRRLCDRVSLMGEPAVVHWRHPLDPGRELSATVEDLSPHGLLVAVPANSFALPPIGESPLTLHIRGERIDLDGELAHLVTDGHSIRFGLRTRARDPRQGTRIAHICRSIQFPTLAPRASASSEAVRRLFVDSGYLGLRKQTHPPEERQTPITNEFVSLDTVHEDPNGALLGHLSCLRVYGDTWMYHQLATVGQSPSSRVGRRALYLDLSNFVPFLGGDSWYSFAYFDRSKVWHKRLFEDFVAWVGSESLATMVPFDRFEVDSAGVDGALLPANISIGGLQSSEAPAAAALVSRLISPLAVRAMDLSEPLIARDLRCASMYAAMGLERGRHPIALRIGGRLAGVAMCEVGSRGISMFNLLNMAQIFLESDTAPEAQAALFSFVRSFYARRGVYDPIVSAPPGTLREAPRVGLALAETMGAFVVSAEGFKQYRNFLRLHLGLYVHDRAEPSRRS
jgi:hypothetical protein